MYSSGFLIIQNYITTTSLNPTYKYNRAAFPAPLTLAAAAAAAARWRAAQCTVHSAQDRPGKEVPPSSPPPPPDPPPSRAPQPPPPARVTTMHHYEQGFGRRATGGSGGGPLRQLRSSRAEVIMRCNTGSSTPLAGGAGAGVGT